MTEATTADGGNLGRFGLLLLTLLLVLGAAPFVSELSYGVPSTSLVFTAVTLAGVYAVSGQRRLLRWALVLAVPSVGLDWLSNAVPAAPLVVSALVLGALFLAFVALAVLYELLDESRVTLDTIFGGICIYLLLGLGWTLLYATFEYVQPGAFQVGGIPLSVHHPGEIRFPELLYYSYVTMTTLGLGDVLPISAPARAFSAAEAVVGQLYVAIFVARLVGLHIVHQHGRAE